MIYIRVPITINEQMALMIDVVSCGVMTARGFLDDFFCEPLHEKFARCGISW